MTTRPKSTHRKGERNPDDTLPTPVPMSVDTFDGKVHVEWDSEASVTNIGQLALFIEFLKLGGRFDGWVDDCPLHYQSNNAPQKIDVLGSLFLSILSGHKRYAHLTALRADGVNPGLLGMKKVVSEDSARKAMKRMNPRDSEQWMQNHLLSCCEPLLSAPWILDVDTTIKPLYGHQELADKGYNPQKPGRPSHTYHTCMVANLRLILDVEVKAGSQSHSSHSLPGLMALLARLSHEQKPAFIRGDIAWGSDTVMRELEHIKQPYLFKLKKSQNVIKLIYKHHGKGEWQTVHAGWEAKEDHLKLLGWNEKRRVIIVRRQLSQNANTLIGLESNDKSGQQQLAFIDGPENMKTYEYAVLVTDTEYDLTAVFYHYRDRADCENNFDELKNQWGWCGYSTKDIHSSTTMAQMVALIYNWWNLYSRLAFPDKHHEAITSRPLLLSSIGRLVSSAGQKKLKLTSLHGHSAKLVGIYHGLSAIIQSLKLTTPQLNAKKRWAQIIAIIMEKILAQNGVGNTTDPPLLPV